MHELSINLHIHTPYSDGNGTHFEIAQAAIKAGLDAVIITDHNVYVRNIEGYQNFDGKSVLVLVGEEIHHQDREPQKNHLLVFDANRELAEFAPDPQLLINKVRDANGLSFIAHPIDPESKAFGEADLGWEDWDVNGFTGIELWNALSEFKGHLKSYPQAIYYAYNFEHIAHGPYPGAIKIWDSLLAKGQKVVAVGGSDAHALIRHLGPFTRILFPYYDHFRAVNTHLLVEEPLTGNLAPDKKQIYSALRQGHAFIGYDLPASTKGFRFSAHCKESEFIMGDTVDAKESATLQIKLPQVTECRLLKDGQVILKSKKRDHLIHKVEEPGVYRVEAYIHFKGKRRAWIFSNPIYVK